MTNKKKIKLRRAKHDESETLSPLETDKGRNGAGTDDDEFANQFQSEPFCVELLTTGQVFYLHETVLTSTSAYFKSLLSSSLATVEQRENRVKFEFHPILDRAFPVVVEYLYTQSYDLETSLSKTLRCSIHISVYLLADRLGIDPLMKLALRKTQEEFDHGGLFQPSLSALEILETIELVYDDDVLENSKNYASERGKQGNTEEPGQAPLDEHKSETEPFKTSDSNKDPRRELQRLVARCTAQNLSRLRLDQALQERFSSGGAFTLDVMMSIGVNSNIW